VIRQHLDITAHVAQVDCLQRAARHLSSDLDVQMAYECGSKAVEWALQGKQGVMTGLRRSVSPTLRWEIEPVPLDLAGDKEWPVPAEYIDADNFGVTPAFHAYLSPLLQGQASIPFAADGLPDCRPVNWPDA
jgi:hypothetical protein